MKHDRRTLVAALAGLPLLGGVARAQTPLVQELVAAPQASSVQLGQFLTIPGAAAIGLLLVVLVLPFVIGFVWAARRTVGRG